VVQPAIALIAQDFPSAVGYLLFLQAVQADTVPELSVQVMQSVIPQARQSPPVAFFTYPSTQVRLASLQSEVLSATTVANFVFEPDNLQVAGKEIQAAAAVYYKK
jgi:hypothetical protein